MAPADAIVCHWATPSNYDAGNIALSAVWTSSAGEATETATWFYAAMGIDTSTSTLATTFAAPASAAGASTLTVKDGLEFAPAETLTPTQEPVADGIMVIEITLNADTMVDDEAILMGVLIEYTTNAATT